MFDANKLLNQILGAGQAAPNRVASGGSPMDQIGGLMGSLLSDSVAGVKEGSAAIGRATGLSGAVGKSGGDIFQQVKDFAGNNRLATGAALGGLGALLLGSRGGRGLLGGGAALGGLAMIGGLAYKAFQNLNAQKAKTPAAAAQGVIEAPPAESPYGETGDMQQDNETARLMLRAMISAAAADGVIDSEERSRIIGGLKNAGLDADAAKFLDTEFARPTPISELAAGARTQALAAQVYTAARVAIEPDASREQMFLRDLANALDLDDGLVSQIDAGASKAKLH